MKTPKEIQCELAIDNLRNKIRDAILHEEIPMRVKPYEGSFFTATVSFSVGRINFSMSVGNRVVSYHNDILDGIFDNEKDRKVLNAIIDKNMKKLTPEQQLIKKFAHCETYCKDSDGYRELDAMTDMTITKLQLELEKQGFFLTYNNVDDCYCIC